MVEFQNTASGVLYVVPTPIGNLADMVPRAIEVLQTVDLIAAEDTRHSAKLLHHFQIRTSLTAYHDHSSDEKLDRLLSVLQQGQNVALISDAGTPLVSDPGYRLVSQYRRLGGQVVPIPGACAAVAALSASGLPSDRFTFEGFPPAKQGARRQCFSLLNRDARTLIFYESPHRVHASLQDMVAEFGADRPAVLAREISKTFETFLTGSLQELATAVENDSNQRRGEIVLMVHGFSERSSVIGAISDTAQLMLRRLKEEGLSLKRAAAITAEVLGEKRNRLYEWGIENLT